MRKAWGARPAVTGGRERVLAVVPGRQGRRSPDPGERRLAVVSARQPAAPVGRDSIVSLARTQLASGSSVLIVGPPGIGKSTVVNALADGSIAGRVLRAAAAEVESGLPYLTLVDLFGAALTEQGSLLPGHLRAALDAALLRTVAPHTPQDELAVRLAVLELVRILAAQSPVLMVIDDLQWVDEPSAGVLHFVARRLAGLPVQVLAAERAETGPVRAQLCPEPYLELPLGPLSRDDVADLLRDRFGPGLSPATVARVHAASGGNPLFAVELGRAVAERGEPTAELEPLPVPDRLRSLLSARLAALSPSAGVALTVLAAAARPTVELLERCGIDAGADLAEAVAAGLVTGGTDGSLAFSHPMLREMLYADADPGNRHAAHERLAAALDDPVERARHLAVIRPDPNEALASTLVDAAAVARRRGAPVVAADLARLAAQRTPDPARAADRCLAAARHAFVGGLTEEAERLAHDALRDAADPVTRIGARLLLVDLAGQDMSGTGPIVDAAFQEAEESGVLTARVRLCRVRKAFYDGDSEYMLAELKRAEQAAEQVSDIECLVEVLAWRGHLERTFQVLGAEDLLERAATLSRGLPLSSAGVTARQMAALARMQRGEVAEAVRRIEELRVAVERAGTVRDLASVLTALASVYSRAGRWADALAAGHYCLRLFSDVAPGAPGPGLLVAALVELGGGTVEQAAVYAEQALAASLAAGDEDWLKGAYAVQGQILLVRGDPVGAVEPMRRSYALEQRRGPSDPSQFLWHADFVEALALAGHRDEAAEVLNEITAQVRRLERDVVQLGLARAAALCTALGGHPREAAQDLTDALHIWADHPYPFELARAWHVLAGIERRAHRRGAAREALLEAIGRYTACGAAPWRAAAEAELARLDGARTGGLSDSERRIVELVRQGATNREIARATYLSVKAVEANLTRLYRRFGVRTRDQLAKILDDG
ncbi:MAG: LuxR family transcriptional regulator [Actinobacteria bacterium]|nr:MAG: LuxR family transcriptional regulator [Actinomycetota bacterium]